MFKLDNIYTRQVLLEYIEMNESYIDLRLVYFIYIFFSAEL